MACDLITDIKTRLIEQAAELGISKDTARLINAAIIDSVANDYAGERQYIGKPEAAKAELSARNRAIIRDWRAGERVPLLSRRYGVTVRRIRQIIAG